jgi:hypothetical protein
MAGKNAKWGEQLIKNGNLEIQGNAGNATWTGLVVKNTATHPNGDTAHGVEISMQMQAYEAGSRDYRPAARIVAIKGPGNDWYTGSASSNFQGQLYFQTRQNDVMQTGLQIDNNGRVTMPYQPAFSIESSHSYSSTGTGEQVFNSNTVYYNNTNIRANIGSHWSSSTGKFTAPVDGTYSFTFNVDIKNHNSGYLLIRIRKNDSQMVGIYPDQTSAKERVTLNTILTLAAQDYVDVSWNNNYATPIFSYASFSGFLIG